MNAIKEGSGPEAPRPDAGDYFVVCARSDSWCVSTTMARHIESILDADPPKRWVTFVDHAGSRVRVRTRQIEFLSQCSAEQRASDRRFAKALREERKADRDWDEE